MPDPPRAEIERLYALPLEEFTAERDALAKRLRKDGDRESADAVKGLKKPSVAAWAINQVRRDRPDDVRRLLEVTDELHRVYAGIAAAGARERLGEAAAMQRELIGSLARCALELLDAAGHGASDATLAKVADTLRAAALDEDIRAEIADGRVVRERRAAGLGPLASMPAPRQERKPSRPAKAAAKPKGPTAAEKKRERERRAAEKELADARAALDAAEKRLRGLGD